MFAQAKGRTVESVLNGLLAVKIPRGSAYGKVKALIDAVNIAIWRLMAVGAEQELFGKMDIIASLKSRFEERTDEMVFTITWDARKRHEDASVDWLKIEEMAAEKWRHQVMMTAWCDAEGARKRAGHPCMGMTEELEAENRRSNAQGGVSTGVQEAHVVTEHQRRTTQTTHPYKLLLLCRSTTQSAGWPRPEAKGRRPFEPEG